MTKKLERDQAELDLTMSKFKTFESLICSVKLSLLKSIFVTSNIYLTDEPTKLAKTCLT